MGRNEEPAINDICRISAGTEIKGTFISKSDIRIDGSFEGDLTTTGKLVLGEKAVVKGNIICRGADIFGNVSGELCAQDIVNFKSSSIFTGNLKTGKICIELGTKFNGNCKIITNEEFKQFQNKQ